MSHFGPVVIVVSSMILMTTVGRTMAAPTFPSTSMEGHRQAKNLPFFDYVQPEVDYDTYSSENDDYVSMALEENELSRTIPSRKRVRQPTYENSPTCFIRLPPQPYMFVPGESMNIETAVFKNRNNARHPT